MSLAETCKTLNISYSTVRVYKSKGLSTEEAIKKASKNSLDNTLSAKIREANIPVRLQTVLAYASNHPELSHEEIIEYYRHKPIPFKELCEQEGVSYSSLKDYRKKHADLSDKQVILKYKKEHNRKTFSDKCREHGVNPKRGLAYRHAHKDKKLSDDDIIKALIDNDNTVSFASKCKEKGLNYRIIADYRRRHPELNLTDEQVIELYLNKKAPFKAKCDEFGLNYATVSRYRSSHPELTDDEVLQYYLQEKEKTWADICKKFNIVYTSFNSYYFHHKDLTKAECILHFRPDLHINLFNDIVEV